MVPDPQSFAQEWIQAWNSHDLDRIMSHCSDDVSITTPMIRTALGRDTGTLRGWDRVRVYWEAALKKAPDLHFELIDVVAGIDSIAVYYRSVPETRAIEVMFFDGYGKVRWAVAHYDRPV